VALAASLDLARTSIRRLEAERTEIVSDLRKHQARLDLMPRRAQELAALTRDYEAVKERQQVVLKKTLEAELSQKVERLQNDETFRVLDPATLPQRPAQPRRLTIALAGIVLAMALAIGAGWGTDRVLDSTFHSARAVEEALRLPVLAMVPAITPPGGRG
jgi:uncharacterized protein involved in exopolysaccharide biosynthesis